MTWLPAFPVLLLSLAPPVATQPGPAPPEAEPADVREARALFSSGQALFRRRKYAAAVVKFEEAYALRPHPAVLYNIARCREELGDVAAALRGYRGYIRQTQALDAELRRLVSQLERKLRERGVQQLTVYAEPAAPAQVVINGRPVGATPATTELPAGDHELLVTVDGYQPERRRFTHGLGQAEDLVVVLTPVSAGPAVVTSPVRPVPPKRITPPAEPKVQWRGFSSDGSTFEGSSGTGHVWHSDSALDMKAEQDAPGEEEGPPAGP